MNIEEIRQYCLSLSHVTETVKWDDDLCFTIDNKMFCILWMGSPLKISFKCSELDFNKFIEKENIIPAPYLAKNRWVQVQSEHIFSKEEWEMNLKNAYRLIAKKLTKKRQLELGIINF